MDPWAISEPVKDDRSSADSGSPAPLFWVCLLRADAAPVESEVAGMDEAGMEMRFDDDAVGIVGVVVGAAGEYKCKN